MTATSSTYQRRQYSPAERARLGAEWLQFLRDVRDGKAQLPEHIRLGEIRVMGKAGDEPARFPCVTTLDRELAMQVIDDLPPAMRFAMDEAARRVEESQQAGQQRIGMQVYPYSDAQGREIPLEQRTPLDRFDPTQHGELLVTFPLSGGC